MIEQKRLQSHPPICTVPEEQKEKIMEIAMRAGHIRFGKWGGDFTSGGNY